MLLLGRYGKEMPSIVFQPEGGNFVIVTVEEFRPLISLRSNSKGIDNGFYVL